MPSGTITSLMGNMASGQLPSGQFFTAPIVIDAQGILRVDLTNIPPYNPPVTDEARQEAKEFMESAGQPDSD